MKRKSIIVDFDSTIANTVKTIFEIYQKETNDYSGEYHTKHMWDFGGLLPKEYVSRAIELFGEQILYDNLEFIDGAKETLLKLSKDFDLTICTVHDAKSIHMKDKWIKDNLPFIDNVVYLTNNTFNKSIIKGDIIIDDRISCLAGDRELKICFGDYGYNTFNDIAKSGIDGFIQKAFDWSDVYNIIENYILK